MVVIGLLIVVITLLGLAGMREVMKDPRMTERFQRVGGSIEALQPLMYAVAVMFGLLGVGFIVLSAGVRRGHRGLIITSIVLTSMVGLTFLLWSLGGVAQVAMIGPAAAGGLCVLLAPLAVAVLLLTWLIGALRAADQLFAMRYAMEYWRYAQQQQQLHGYSQTGAPPSAPPTQPPPFPPQQ
jgi:hypothetical protein